MNNKKNKMERKIKCMGCLHFYITYKKERPWGCKKFGFISKLTPSIEVFKTTGTECAYRFEKKFK